MKSNGILQDSIEQIASKHLDISLVSPTNSQEHTVGAKQLHLTLQEAFKAGERYGYMFGFDVAKNSCDCVFDETVDNITSVV